MRATVSQKWPRKMFSVCRRKRLATIYEKHSHFRKTKKKKKREKKQRAGREDSLFSCGLEAGIRWTIFFWLFLRDGCSLAVMNSFWTGGVTQIVAVKKPPSPRQEGQACTVIALFAAWLQIGWQWLWALVSDHSFCARCKTFNPRIARS